MLLSLLDLINIDTTIWVTDFSWTKYIYNESETLKHWYILSVLKRFSLIVELPTLIATLSSNPTVNKIHIVPNAHYTLTRLFIIVLGNFSPVYIKQIFRRVAEFNL